MLDNRLELAMTFLVGALPVTRTPVLGWAVATVEQQTWRRDVDFQRPSRVVTLLYPAVTRRVVDECRSRGIPVMRDDGADADQPIR